MATVEDRKGLDARDVLARVQEENIEFVRFWFTDIFGALKSFAVGKDELDEAFDHYYLGPELEFFLFKDDQGTEILDKGGYFDLTTLDVASDFRRDVVFTLRELGIPVEYTHHEVGPSQHEIDMRYADGLEMA